MVLKMMIYINYLFTIVGIGMIIVSLFLIIADKIKGENIYYDLCSKEQDIRKAIDEANEMISELIFTSETVVNEIENHIRNGVNVKLANDIDNYVDMKRKEGKNIMVEEEIEQESVEINDENRDAKVESILSMYNSKMSIEEIAKKLQMGKGEVALILSLNRGIKSNEGI
ncbi:hypothetical protein SAMN02745176_02291 [Lutispora thermophila DSM 19022]|uniref:DUF2802 domain-containing protein n=2 Tax=Lutispora TaxID=667112 RepID=A0A1M6G8Q5_9FIRM|nr:hypothetical protein SAMN02745176_02291 [Lutispora thermophila DSM 19022]